MVAIIHYGILGMKWGVRKEDNISQYGGKITKGTIVNRVSSVEKESFNGAGYFYKPGLLTKELETDYIKNIENYVSTKSKTSTIYKMDVETKVDLVLPSMVEKGKIFVDGFLKNSNNKNMIIEAYGKYVNDEHGSDKEYFKKMMSNNIKELEDELVQQTGPISEITSLKTFGKAYYQFTAALNNKEVSRVYGQILAKRGYNAVTDDFDNEHLEKKEAYNLKDQLTKKIRSLKKDFLSASNEQERKRIQKDLEIVKKESKRSINDMAKDFSSGSIIVFDRKNLTVKHVQRKVVVNDELI